MINADEARRASRAGAQRLIEKKLADAEEARRQHEQKQAVLKRWAEETGWPQLQEAILAAAAEGRHTCVVRYENEDLAKIMEEQAHQAGFAATAEFYTIDPGAWGEYRLTISWGTD